MQNVLTVLLVCVTLTFSTWHWPTKRGEFVSLWKKKYPGDNLCLPPLIITETK